jgi:hypothetical protein
MFFLREKFASWSRLLRAKSVLFDPQLHISSYPTDQPDIKGEVASDEALVKMVKTPKPGKLSQKNL